MSLLVPPAYVMSLRPFWIFTSFSVGTAFSRHNLASIDVRFWCLKTVPAMKGFTEMIVTARHIQYVSQHVSELLAYELNLDSTDNTT